MGRKREVQAGVDGYYKDFPTRLRTLLRDTRTTQATLAEYLGIARQSVAAYCSGESTPSWEGIVKIARFFSCSSDYLLGLSEYHSRVSEEIRVADLGLSEEAVNKICTAALYLQEEPDSDFSEQPRYIKEAKCSSKRFIDGLSAFLETPFSSSILEDIVVIKQRVDHEKENLANYDFLDSLYINVEKHPNYLVLDGHEACNYLLRASERKFRMIMEKATGYRELEKLTDKLEEERIRASYEEGESTDESKEKRP